MSSSLKLVILYDARNNAYAVCGHNLTAEEAQAMVVEYGAKLLLALSVDQRTRHRAADAEACHACRRDVASASGLEPKPTFQRRNER